MWDNVESVFSVRNGARKYPLSLGLVGEGGVRVQSMMFFLFCKLSVPSRGRSIEKLSLLPSPSFLGRLNCSPGLLATAGENKTTAMQHQTGLHRVYAMTEAWAQLQRGWGSLQQHRQPFHIQGCAMEAARTERPLAVIASKSLISSGGPEIGNELAKVVHSTEV